MKRNVSWNLENFFSVEYVMHLHSTFVCFLISSELHNNRNSFMQNMHVAKKRILSFQSQNLWERENFMHALNSEPHPLGMFFLLKFLSRDHHFHRTGNKMQTTLLLAVSRLVINVLKIYCTPPHPVMCRFCSVLQFS